MALASAFALERPGVIHAYAISSSEFPAMAQKYGVGGVPHTVVNDEHSVVGLQQDAPFAEFVLNMKDKEINISEAPGFDPAADSLFGDSAPSQPEKAPEAGADFASAPSIFGNDNKTEQYGEVLDKGDEYNCDLLVLGGGPAGLTAAVYGARSGLTVTVLDSGMLGGQVSLTPVIENYMSYKAMPGSQLASSMVEHAKQYAHVRGNLQITNLEAKDGKFVASTSNGQYSGRSLLFATGSTWRKLGVPGEVVLSGRGVHNCASCDGYMYVGKKIVVVGGGNTALTDALHLKNLGIDVTVIHRRDEFRGEKALAKAIEKNGIKVEWDSVVTEIVGKDQVTGIKIKNVKTEQIKELPIDGVFVSVGQEPNSRPARAVGAKVTEQGYIEVDKHMRTTTPRVYAAGDVTGGFQQIVVAVAEGAQAAHTAFMDLQEG
ncbi:FAD-dependent oxidoreductase [Desulfovibrio sp. OttesenSCG-928-C06]|nr:FAD-dependent oxidoreductase [Desulfovibrio sp. OttesenSCG-928-C06]